MSSFSPSPTNPGPSSNVTTALTVFTTNNATVAENNATVELLTNLIPALMKTFLVILAGYLFGRTNLYPKENAGALGRLCGTLLLPVSMFNAMATLVVSSEAWTFLYAVAICKGGIFVVVLCITLLVDRAKGRIGRSAIWAVFSTQSNDFALGLPIFNVLYDTSHPTYIYFLYIVAPVNLVVLNPIAFVLMEYSRKSADGKKFDCKSVAMVLRRVFTNPLVLLTFAGLIVRLCLWSEKADDYPAYANYIEPVLDVVSDAFTGCALFSLGLLIVGKFALLKKNSPLKAILFIIVKSFVLPVLLKLTLDLLSDGDTDLSTAGFLYGIIPTASGVFTYCLQFGMNPDLIAISMVIGTIASAPLMLALGSMVAIASDSAFDSQAFVQAVPYFKMVPGAFSIIGVFLFIIGTAVRWRKLHEESRVYRICFLSAASMLALCYACLYPCQIILGATTSNATDPLLHTPSAKALFIINLFCLTFYRGMVSCVSVITCFMLRYRVNNGVMPPAKEQNGYIWKAHLAVLAVCVFICVFIAAATDLEQDSCISVFSTTLSEVTCAIQLLFVVTNLVGLVWYTRLRHRLHQSPEFRDDTDTFFTRQQDGATAVSMTDFSNDEKKKAVTLAASPEDRASVSSIGLLAAHNAEVTDEYGNESVEEERGQHGGEEADDTETGKEGDNGTASEQQPSASIAKTHPSSRFLEERLYTRRFGIIVYETCSCMLGAIVLFLGVIDYEGASTDTIFFAVTFVVGLLTYSSGMVLSICIGFPMLDCKRKEPLSVQSNWAQKAMEGIDMNF